MSYIFLFIGVLYSIIFLFFYKTGNPYFSSFTGSLFIEIIGYFLIGFYLFFHFLNFSSKKNKKEVVLSNYSFSLNKKQIINLIQKFSYHFGFILFYISLSIFSYFFKIDFSYFIFLVNSLIIFFFFLSEKSNLSKDFLRINSNLFSFFYIILFIFIILSKNNFLGFIDIINSFLIIFSSLIIFYFNNFLKNKISSNFSIFYVIFFSFFFLIYLINTYLFGFSKTIFFSLSILSIFYSYIIFIYLPKINIFKKNIIILRFISIIFLYFGILSSIICLIFYGLDLFIILFLIISIFLNYYFHYHLENYLSFIISIFSFLFIIYFLLFSYNGLNFFTGIIFFIINFLLAFAFIGLAYKIKFKYLYDYYIIIFTSYFINIIGVLLYLGFNFDILNMGTILFLDSIYFFVSYYRMKNIKTYFLIK